MNIFEFLNCVEESEQQTADLYEQFSRQLKSDEVAAQFFYKLHLQEIDHRNLVRFTRRTIDQNSGLFENIELDPGQYAFFPINLEKILRDVPGDDLRKMLSQADRVEESLSESTALDSLPKSIPQLSGLLERLILDSHSHRMAVRDFALSRHYRLNGDG